MENGKIVWSEFGYHDIVCQVPSGWDAAHLEGTYEKGYARLDDTRTPRLEIRWERPKRRVLLARTIDNHIKLLAKEAKKLGRGLSVQRNMRLTDLPFAECEFFSYKNHVEAVGLATRCEGCGRVLILRVFAGQDSLPLHGVAKHIFQTLRDHPAEGKSRWNLYGFCFDVPEQFHLVSTELKTGRLRFDFAHKGAQLTVVRAALAHLLLRGRTLGDWVEEAMPKIFRGFVVERREEEFRGHPSIVFFGRYKLRLRLTRLMFQPWFLHCRVWHCESSDKIFFFRALGRQKDKIALEKCEELVYCH